MRRRLTAGAVATATSLAAFLVGMPGTPASAATATEYTVVADDGVSTADAIAAITAAGGTVVSANTAVGTYRVSSAAADFKTRAAKSDELIGASANRPSGTRPARRPRSSSR